MARAVAFLVAELGPVVFLARGAVDALPEAVDGGVVADALAGARLAIVADTVAAAESARAAGARLVAAGTVEASGALVARASELVAAPVSLGR